jgi:hypothetical protein
MPKDRKLTYSDRQAQAARDKKQSVQKPKMSGETSGPNPASIAPKTKKKR